MVNVPSLRTRKELETNTQGRVKVEKNPLTFRISQRIITVMCIKQLRFAYVKRASDTTDRENIRNPDDSRV